MLSNLTNRIIIILLVMALALWLDLSPQIKIPNPIEEGATLFLRDVNTRLGLDLRGGLQVLLEADVPVGTVINRDEMETARDIVENRTNAMGVSENLIQVAGDRRIVGEFPGVEDSDAVLDIIQQTGLLEFVDTGDFSPEEGTIIQTDFITGSAPAAPSTDGTQQVYHTIMTGKELTSVSVSPDQLSGRYQINFSLSTEGTTIFANHTALNTGKYLTIVLDKRVISSPVINSSIPDGQGSISGNFTADTANELAVQLKYGSLPIPLKVVETRIIGPTLGEDSLQKSLRAGLIGMIVVVLFMAIYYRMPGIVADLSILFFAAITFAIFKYSHFTLTLPSIAGFLLSTGAALDANILIFERLKEELRNGRNLTQAVDQGWKRAWPSIWESNATTIITSIILFWFGSTFGATLVKGFSLTLFLGVVVSLFTAIFVTRTLLTAALQTFKPTNYERWFGI
ncbi:MAG TPA: protein translocase subunit SecD [Anaerolineales bacterium]|nr:protein translocase subunit SecD [Anaerolineales bacterium]